MLIIVVTMFVVLFAFLAGGLWIGWTLAVTGTILLALFRDIPLDKLLAQYAWNILTTQELLALPLFILMGEILFRTRLSQSLFRGLVAVGGAAAGPAAARQRHRLLDLRRHLRLVGGDDAGRRPHLARRAAEARLFQGRRRRLARRRRHAGLPDPALQHHDHLRRAGRRLDRQAVHRGLHPGLPAGRLLHGLDHDPHRAQAGTGAGSRAQGADRVDWPNTSPRSRNWDRRCS